MAEEVVVVAGKEFVLFQKIIEKRRKERQLNNAYLWATDFQQEHGFVASPISVEFLHGDRIDAVPHFTAAVFHEEETDRALLVRFWEDQMVVVYNVLTNYGAIAKVAPKALEQMLQNGLALKERLEETLL